MVISAWPVCSYWMYSNTGYFSETVWRKSHIQIIGHNKLCHFSPCRFNGLRSVVGWGNLITDVQNVLNPVGLFFWRFHFIWTAHVSS
jgi:hypothetical protein